jgi:hypothetical protein
MITRDYVFPSFTPGKPRLPAGFRLLPDADLIDPRALPVTVVIPPVVATNDLITAVHENAVRQALADLWTNVQYLEGALAADRARVDQLLKTP